LVAEAGVDHVFEFFEYGTSGDEASHALCEHDFGPVFGRDVVGGVNHPERFVTFGCGDDKRVGHGVVGAREGNVLGYFGRFFSEFLF